MEKSSGRGEERGAQEQKGPLLESRNKLQSVVSTHSPLVEKKYIRLIPLPVHSLALRDTKVHHPRKKPEITSSTKIFKT